ncbi:MAG TPA: hypothetical protein VHF51_14255, partial [Solirubrobacteraceae bacterium]|nr:hypothetical protein [Solirubrobacteraceae bacterium]
MAARVRRGQEPLGRSGLRELDRPHAGLAHRDEVGRAVPRMRFIRVRTSTILPRRGTVPALRLV